MLAMSLSCIIAGTAFAASATEQPLISQESTRYQCSRFKTQWIHLLPKHQQPNLQILLFQLGNREQYSLQASETLDGLQAAEVKIRDIGPAPDSSHWRVSSAHANKASWTLDGLNNAQWYEETSVKVSSLFTHVHMSC